MNKKQEQRADYEFYKLLLLKTEVCRNWAAFMLVKNPICRHGEKRAFRQLLKRSDMFLNHNFNTKLRRDSAHNQKQLEGAKAALEDGADFLCEGFMQMAVVPDSMQEEYLKRHHDLIANLINESRNDRATER